MDFYLGMVAADMDAAEGVFMHYGRRVTGDRTPEDYDMEDGDEVSFFPDGTWTTPVTLTVTDNNGRRVTHTMRKLHILDILFDLYFAMLPSTAPREGVFIYHCRELSPRQTPEECNMKDGDEFSKPSAFVTLTIKGNNNGGSSVDIVTRTMLRTQERLHDLIDLYFAMVPTDDEHGEFDVTYCGRKVDGEKTPADYGMEDGDQLRLAPATERGRFVTINLVTMVGVKRAYTLRRTDELQGLMDLCLSREPASMYQNGCIFLYNGRRRVQGSETPDDLELKDGDSIDLIWSDNLKLEGWGYHPRFRLFLRRGREHRSGMSSSATGGEADSPSPEVEPSVLVTLRVKDTEGVRITSTMRRTGKLHDLTDFYLAMVVPAAVAQGHVCRPVGVFMHYGRRVTGYETPADYDMDDGDEVSFFPDGVMSSPVTLTVKDSKGRRTVTRTMRRIEKLDVLFDLYHAMLPSAAPREGFFVYGGRKVDGLQMPTNYHMGDSDEITFVPISKPSMLVTLKMKGRVVGRSVTRTMRRTDKLQDLIDFYEAMVVPADGYCDGECQVVYGGQKV
uniref:Ubiquitin-like domain-containing protein n=1 Tax=Oryza meridionalis TaxID=40149 RepID=A0A0E0EDG5_9ORYZ